jgi:Zn-dependent protease
MDATNAIFYIAILIMSVVIHEVSHGYIAEYFGDKTARFAGRLTLNPIKHLDIFGSILLPALLVISQSPFLIGWAKPVPYNPENLSDRKWGTIGVAAAGVLANFSVAIFFGILIRFAPTLFGLPLYDFSSPHPFYVITKMIVIVNLGLGIFNLVPIPPLDGSKILFNLLPSSFDRITNFLETYSLILIIVFVVFLSNYLYPILAFLFHLFTGLYL